MELDQVTYKGPVLVDEEILTTLPNNLSSLLRQINGFIQYDGGFHVFGACHEPKWHSIRELWHGDHAAHKHYSGIKCSDIPFAEDCLGFQFFLREGGRGYLSEWRNWICRGTEDELEEVF